MGSGCVCSQQLEHTGVVVWFFEDERSYGDRYSAVMMLDVDQYGVADIKGFKSDPEFKVLSRDCIDGFIDICRKNCVARLRNPARGDGHGRIDRFIALLNSKLREAYAKQHS